MELRPFTPEHFSALASWFPTEASLIQWGGPKVIHPLDDAQMQAMLDEAAYHPPTRQCWMAFEDEGIVGHAQLAFDWKNGSAVLGRVAIAPECLGRGFAVPMLALVLTEAFRYPEIVRLELNVFSFNTPAIRTYTRLGFLVEGTRRSALAVGNERWDTIIMAMLRSEYSPIP